MSGGMKLDTGKPRTDLLPVDALLDVAQVLDYGAKKYTLYGKCSCGATTAEPMGSSTLSGDAEAATRNAFATSTPPSQPTSEKMPGSGSLEIESESERVTSGPASQPLPGCMALPSMNTGLPELVAASSVEPTATSASTMTTPQGLFAAASVSPATSASGGLKSEAGSSEHSSTCASRRIVNVGERNWERGMAWGRMGGALLRHTFRWMNGEEIDPESNLHHLAHAACCSLMLLSMVKRQIGTDDRKALP